MLYKFKSQAASDVLMLQASAEELLRIIGKSPGATGIVTVQQAQPAVAALKAEIARREALGNDLAAPTNQEQADAEADPAHAAPGELVSLRQRAAPFIELLERSSEAGKDVVWGV